MTCNLACCLFALQESAKYAHSLFQNTVKLYGRSMRVDYSPQGNPEARSTVHINIKGGSSTAPLGSLAAAGGGFILRRKNRNVDPSTLPPSVQPQEAV